MIQILANEYEILKFQDYLDTNGRNSRIEKIENHKANNQDYFLVSFKRSVGSYYPSFEDLLDKNKNFYTIPEIKKTLEKDAKREFYACCKEERFTENQINLMYDPNVPDEVLIEKKLMILNGFESKLKEVNRYNLNYQQLNSIRTSLICGGSLQHSLKKNKDFRTVDLDFENIRHYQARDLLKYGIAYPYFNNTHEIDNVYQHKYWQNMKLENRPFNEAILKFAADKGHEKWYQFYSELKDLIKNSDDFLKSGDVNKLYKNNVYEHIVRMNECYAKMNNNIYSVHISTISKYRDALLNSKEEYNFDDFLKLYQEREAEIRNIESPYVIEIPYLPEKHETKEDLIAEIEHSYSKENGLIDIFCDKLGEELKTASYDNVKKIVYALVENRTEDFIKTLLSIEKGIKDEKTLKILYNEYMENDSMQLLDSNFDHLLENLEEEMKLYQAQEIAKIKM